MNVKIKIYDKCKYDKTSKKITEAIYKNIKWFEVVEIEEEEFLKESDCIDDCNEYLIIMLENGTKATFRNSYVDMYSI